jgi:hypothetical protein
MRSQQFDLNGLYYISPSYEYAGVHELSLSSGSAYVYKDEGNFDLINLSSGSAYIYNGDGDFDLISDSLYINENGSYDVTNYASVEVNAGPSVVEGVTFDSEHLYRFGESGLDYLYDGLFGVNSYRGAYTEIELSSGSAYIYGNNHSFDAIQLPEAGEKTTVEIDYSNYDIFNEDEAVIPNGTLDITENGEDIDVSQYAAVNVDVAGVSELQVSDNGFSITCDG